jgi:putative membrane protein
VTTPASSERFEVTPNATTHFALLRTRLAVERTLLSWVRTAMALIGFGFTIVKLFTQLNKMSKVPALEPHAAHYFGISLVAIGTLALCISVWQYQRFNRYLWTQFAAVAGMEGKRQHTPTLAIAICLIFVGIAVFVALLVRLP